MSKYRTQIRGQVSWLWMRLKGKNEHPKPCLWYPTDGWISDPKEIENAMRLDDAFEVKKK